VQEPLSSASTSAREYANWAASQSVPIISGNYQRDLNSVELHPWDNINGRGVLLNHDRSVDSNDCWVVEIAPGTALCEEKHLFETMIYVLSGEGATEIWTGDERSQTVSWQTGTLFAVPLNFRHQHRNTSTTQPVRLLVVTNAPIVMNTFQSLNFVFGCDYEFADRYNGEADYFQDEGKLDGRVLHRNLIPDAGNFQLVDYPERGGGGTNIHLFLAGGALKAHISEFAVGKYKKAHRHGPGAHVLILEGEGYSLMWKEGDEPTRYDWGPGSLVVPPDNWFHQHFNVGDRPARYLAMRYIDTQIRNEKGIPLSNISTREGGNQIEYEDQAPQVEALFQERLRAARERATGSAGS
jgi:quercetin dioxygenase-like cupin family protein